MNAAARKFEDAPATRAGHVTPLIIGVTAEQGAGKTWSALRLATGIQRVVGGDIYGIDAEDGRMLAYSDYFKFRHVPFDPPHGPDDYRAAISHCAQRGASIVIVDQLSSEHDGEGGVLDQIEQYIEDKGGGEQHKWTAHIIPKRARRKLNREIVHLAKSIVFILLYRAEEKTRPTTGGKAEKLGLQTISTSSLPYSMTVRFLLSTAGDGVPILQPTQPAERRLIKNPEQFKGWFVQGEPLCEDMGERMALWARGGSGSNEFDRLIGDFAKCADKAAFDSLLPRMKELWKKDSPQKPRLKEASDAAFARIKGAPAPAALPESKPPNGKPDNATWITTLTGQPSSAELTKAYDKCTDAYGGLVPLEVSDAYEATRERLVEQEAKQQY
jgi:hypothetical protein